MRIQKFLAGLSYPAAKHHIVERARALGADDAVMRVLRKIPEGWYDSPVAVARAAGPSSVEG